MEWDKFWSTNAKVLDVNSARYMAVAKDSAVELRIANYSAEPVGVQVPKHPKDPSMGNKVRPCRRAGGADGDADPVSPSDRRC